MADHTKIEWTDATWNPVTGCSVVSPGCTNCYAMKLAGTRLQHHPSRAGLTRETKAGLVWNGTVRFNEEWLTQPLRWKRPRMVFVCAHGDLGHPDIPTRWLDRIFTVMMLARRHTFQVLTKRPERLREYLTDPGTPGRIARMAVSIMADGVFVHPHDAAQITYAPDPGWQFGQKPIGLTLWPLPNIWLGVSAEDQTRADERVPELLATPAAIRFVSAEPLIGQIDFSQYLWPVRGWWKGPYASYGEAKAAGAECGLKRQALVGAWCRFLDWIIVGGESGKGARPMHPDWARSIRDQCEAAGTAFFFKQWGEWQPRHWKADGGTHAMRVTAPDWGCFQQIQSHPNSIERVEPAPEGWQAFAAVGKKAAGRQLDSVEHNAMPRAA